MSSKKKSPFYLTAFGAVLALGLIASAFILGQQFKNLQQTGVITVKGLAEAEYKASLGDWRLTVSSWNETYKGAMESNQQELNRAVKFLKEQGFEDAERAIEPISVSEHLEYYEDEKGNQRSRKNGFDASRSIIITTKQLDKLTLALKNIQNVRAEDQSIDFNAPHYYLENLESIKRELISKATQDAFVRAEEFAKVSNVKVGVLKEASQGSFDIQSATPSSEDSSDYGGGYDTSTIDKRVRLVVTIKYAIE